MSLLLDANFKRLKKSKSLYILIFISMLIAIFKIMFELSETYTDYVVKLEDIIFFYPLYIGFIIAIFTSLFLGVEYTDGVIKNKIMVGHKRVNIYLANLITISFGSLIFYLSYVIISLIIGIPLFGSITISSSKLIVSLISILVILLAYSSIFTFIQMLTYNKIVSTIVNLSLIVIFFLVSFICNWNLINIQDENPNYIDSNGNIYYNDERAYINNPKWKFYRTLNDINLYSQANEILNGDDKTNYGKLSIYATGITVITTTLGLLIFNKKDLK